MLGDGGCQGFVEAGNQHSAPGWSTAFQHPLDIRLHALVADRRVMRVAQHRVEPPRRHRLAATYAGVSLVVTWPVVRIIKRVNTGSQGVALRKSFWNSAIASGDKKVT